MSNAPGRWPANVILDEHAAALVDAQSGDVTGCVSSGRKATSGAGAAGIYLGKAEQREWYGDSGGASRFFYVAKASRSERGQANTHPTVKPVALMKHLVRLVTPPGGLVLDPFLGSGTTGIAAVALGHTFVGLDLSADYLELARARTAKVQMELA